MHCPADIGQEFCEQCAKSNHEGPLTRKHKLVPIAEKPVQEPRCKEHQEKITFFCTKCMVSALSTYASQRGTHFASRAFRLFAQLAMRSRRGGLSSSTKLKIFCCPQVPICTDCRTVGCHRGHEVKRIQQAFDEERAQLQVCKRVK